jgi:S1-C subfamily serine protease
MGRHHQWSAVGLCVFLAAFAGAAEEPGKERERARAELRQVGAEVAKLSRAFNLIHEIVAPSVVSIHTRERMRVANFLSGHAMMGEVEVGEGSGFIFQSDDKASYVLTNSHVVLQTNHQQEFIQGGNGQPVGYDRVRVVLNDNREVDAEYVGYYLRCDLAVLRLPMARLPVIEWGDSDQAKVGDWVLALGYPLGVGYSATSGIISATDRSTGIYQGVSGFDSFIQTDAAINPGNSGGPLVNIQGQVVGMNASIISKTGANIGLGFAIPANLARRAAEDIVQFGKVRRPVVGVQIEDLGPDQAKELGLPQSQTVRVNQVYPESPAAAADLRKGDVILAVNQTKVVSLQQFQARIASCKLGEPLMLRLLRAGAEMDKRVIPIAEEELERKLAGAARETSQRRGVALDEFGFWLGADDQPGLVITTIDPSGLAEQAGLAVGDRVLHERTIGALRTLDEAKQLAKRRELILQVYQDGRSYWLRMRR